MRLKRQPNGHSRHSEHKMVSDRSGFVFPAGEIVRQWDGLLVHKDEEEPRHPQEFVRGVVDDYAVRNPRPPAPYEAEIATGSDESAVNISERDGEDVITRLASNVTTRGEVYNLGEEFFSIDLGSIKSVSRVLIQLDFLSAGKSVLNLYTSLDGATYQGLDQPFLDNLRNITIGSQLSFPIGRRARYLELRFDVLNGAIQAGFDLSQFAVLGEV